MIGLAAVDAAAAAAAVDAAVVVRLSCLPVSYDSLLYARVGRGQ